MGFLDWFKEEEEPDVISFEEIPEWLDDFMGEKNLEKRVKKFKKETRKNLKEINELVDELEDKDLMNPDIPDQEKNLMKGNRKHYVKAMKRFINDVELPHDYTDIGYFSSRFSEKVDELGDRTGKNFMVLKQFFENEVKEIASKVNEIKERANEFRQELEDEDLDVVDDVKLKLKQLEEKKEEKKNLLQEKKDTVDYIQELQEKKGRIKDKLSELKNSNDFDRYEGLKEEKEKLEEQLKNLKKEIRKDFSSLERALKKYAHNSVDEDFVNEYLEKPVAKLQEDTSLKIKKILEEVDKNLESLDLDDRKKESAEKLLDSLTEELDDRRESMEKLREEIDQTKKNILNNVTAMNISEQEDFLENTQMKVEDQKEELHELDNKLERINLDLEKQNIRKKVEELGNVEFE